MDLGWAESSEVNVVLGEVCELVVLVNILTGVLVSPHRSARVLRRRGSLHCENPHYSAEVFAPALVEGWEHCEIGDRVVKAHNLELGLVSVKVQDVELRVAASYDVRRHVECVVELVDLFNQDFVRIQIGRGFGVANDVFERWVSARVEVNGRAIG